MIIDNSYDASTIYFYEIENLKSSCRVVSGHWPHKINKFRWY